ncbi:MAG: GNAT family N-acetyltransferase [Chloroflexi bacterium]|nr:GNAT family N-acetyltransferase [Chloroflexota bacterium]
MTHGRYRSETLGERHPRADFSCGVEALDRYFHQQAGQDQRRGLAVPYVLVDTTSGAVVGYYTLSTLSIVPASLPVAVTRRLPRYQTFPGILIGRLAVDQRARGQGLGAMLLMDALRRCLDLSRQIGAMAVVVDARDEAARAFYERYGFLRLVDHDYRLFLPMATIAQL